MQVVVYEVHPDEGYKAEVSYEGTARVRHQFKYTYHKKQLIANSI